MLHVNLEIEVVIYIATVIVHMYVYGLAVRCHHLVSMLFITHMMMVH